MSEADAEHKTRTERVTLELTGRFDSPPSAWPWEAIFSHDVRVHLEPRDSVRVVEEPESSDRRHRWDRDGERCLKCNDKDWMGGPCNTTNEEYIEKLKDERDAAIRERDQLRVKRDELQTGCIRLNAQLKQKNAPHKTALEAAIKGMERMQAERDAFKDLLAAAEYEPVANPFPTVGRMIEETCKQLALAMRVADIEKRRGDKCFAELKAAICERDELKARVAELESDVADCNIILGDRWREAVSAVTGTAAPPTPPQVHRGSGVFDANGDEVPWEGVVAMLTDERDAAIRERDTLRAERITQALTADRFAAAVAEADTLRARVVSLESQLESVADRAAAAETALEAAPAASGAANGEISDGVLALEHMLYVFRDDQRPAVQSRMEKLRRLVELLRDQAPAASEWRMLALGEIVRLRLPRLDGSPGDEYLQPDGQWVEVSRSHQIRNQDIGRFRRRVPAPAASVVPSVVRDMTDILRSNATDDEKHAAMATLVEAVCPGWRLAPAASVAAGTAARAAARSAAWSAAEAAQSDWIRANTSPNFEAKEEGR